MHYTLVAVDFLSDAAITAALDRLAGRLATGTLLPLPWVTHGLSDATAALRAMSAARHVGKVVVTNPATDLPPSARVGRVLVTGGLGSLGSLTAAWLARDCRLGVHVVGRSGRAGAASGPLLDLLRRGHAGELAVGSGDGGVAADATALTQRATGVPLVGLLHAAGVLSDATIANQGARGVRAVLAPKSGALAALARAGLAEAPAAFGVLFSSIAALLGSPGQSNYAGANAALDVAAELAQHRGAATLSVQWGAWAGAGMAGADAQTRARAERTGVGMLPSLAGLAALRGVLAAAAAGPVLAAVPISWPRYLQAIAARPGLAMFDEFAGEVAVEAVRDDTSVAATRPATTSALPVAAAGAAAVSAAALTALVTEAVTAVLGPGVDPEAPLMAAGLDSLSSVEFRNSLEAKVGADLPTTLVFDYPTIAGISAFLAERVGGATAGESADAGGAVLGEPTDADDMFGTGEATVSSLAGPLVAVPAGSTVVAQRPSIWVGESVTQPPRSAFAGLQPVDAVALLPLSRWDIDTGEGGLGLYEFLGIGDWGTCKSSSCQGERVLYCCLS